MIPILTKLIFLPVASTGSTSSLKLRHRICRAFLCVAQSVYVQKKLDSNAHLLPWAADLMFFGFVFPFVEVVDPSVSKQIQVGLLQRLAEVEKNERLGRRKPRQVPWPLFGLENHMEMT